MLWALFSVSAAFTWAVVNTVDKYVLSKWVRNPIVPVMFVGIIGFLAGILVYFFHGFSPMSYQNIALALAAGFFSILMSIFYFKAVQIEEISRVVPLLYLSPLFVSIFAAIFLGEIFTPLNYLGILFLVLGAVFISSKSFLKLSFGKAFWLMILASLALSMNAIISKYLLNFVDFWTIFSYARIGAMLTLIPVFFFCFPAIVSTAKEHGKKAISVISLNQSFNVLAILLITIATAVGPVTLVNSLASIQPFFVFLFAVILSVFYPRILREEIGKSVVLLKLTAIILIFAGAVLIT